MRNGFLMILDVSVPMRVFGPKVTRVRENEKPVELKREGEYVVVDNGQHVAVHAEGNLYLPPAAPRSSAPLG